MKDRPIRWPSFVPLVLGLACGRAEPTPETSPTPTEDPALACARAHPVEPRWQPIVRAMCSELRTLGGVSVAVAVAEGDRIVWSLAIGPRCRDRPEPLRPGTTLRIGSITKPITAASALTLARREGVGLDEPLPALLPGPGAPPTLRCLLQHTCGLRDPPGLELLAADERWPELLADHREAAGPYYYANADYLLVGRWIERVSGRPAQDRLDDESLAPLRDLVGFDPLRVRDPGCGHRRGLLGWSPVGLPDEPPLPTYTRPSGGGLASVEQLARLPAALERTDALPMMTASPVPTPTPDVRYGLGVRVLEVDGATALAHAGLTDAYWAELQWSPTTGTSVAVVSSTPQPFAATTLAAFEAATSP